MSVAAARKGFGYRPDVHDPRDWDAFDPTPGKPRLFSARAMTGYPSECDHANAAHVEDQGATSSCVAQSGCNAAELYNAIRGVTLPRLSRRAAYDWGRGGRPPFRDEGCFPRVAMSAWRDWGFCREHRWPWDERRINDPLTLDVVKAGADARLVSFYRVTGSGAERCEKARIALAEGYPLIYGQRVYRDFEAYAGGVLTGAPQGADLGGHMTTIVGYVPGAFHCVNSWGTSWGEAGFYWIGDDRFGGDTVSDVYVFTSAPTVVR